MKKLINLLKLSCKVSVYIPSTRDVNKEIDNSPIISNALAIFSSAFGGATVTQALGAWVTTNGQTIKEPVSLVYSYCTTEQLQGNIDLILNFCEKVKNDLSQEAIAIEINGELYFI